MFPEESQRSSNNSVQLEEAVEAFARAWNQSSTPPAIDSFIQQCESGNRIQLAIELVKIDLERRWQCGLRRLVEDYTSEIPDLKDRITPQLILEEYHARKLAGDDVDSREYFERFPRLRSSLEMLLQVDPLTSTQKIDPATIDPVPGEAIDDFDLLTVLGKGAFATVFLARQRSMQRIVAVKISTEQSDEPRTLAQLDHVNIVRVYDQRTLEPQGIRLLYMQYAPGGTLDNVIKNLQGVAVDKWDGTQYLRAIDSTLELRGESAADSAIRRQIADMAWPQLVSWIGTQLSRAMHYAHQLGVLHRDLKPANVLLTADGVPKLADFNISFNSQIEGAKPERNFGGSLAYMSLEQLEAISPAHPRKADSLDHRTDQYSMGVLIWELLTGQLPFPNDLAPNRRTPLLDKMIERRRRGLESIPEQPRESLPLRQVLRRCLAANADDRYSSCREQAQEFELCLQPLARELFNPAPGGWKVKVNRFPLISVVLVTLIPNLIAAIFNFLYNHAEILDRLPDAEPTFMRIQAIINAVAFPTGILSSRWLVASVTSATRASAAKKSTPAHQAEQRSRCLNLGHTSAAVGLILWLIAAPIYPISLHLILGSVPTELYLHFVASLVLCGLIAAAYPFFGVTFIAVRCFYPALVDRETMTTDDRLRLQRLLRQTWVYLNLAFSVPMIAIITLALANPGKPQALIVVAASGVLGSGIAITAFGLIRLDLNTLIQAIWHDNV